jgi:hypothetical protein
VSIRNRPFAACALAVAFVVSAGSALRAADARAGHLFVATLGQYSGSQMERFPIVNGRPAKQPDLVFPSAAAPLAVAADGTVYAQDDRAFAVDVFPPGLTAPVRQLMLNPCGPSYIYNGITALALDAAGYLYVAVDGGISGSKPDSGGCQGETVVVYPPGAGGNTPPVKFIGFNLYASAPSLGIAIGGSGALAITRAGNNDTFVFAHPLAPRERLTQLFWSHMNGPEGIAYDTPEREIFVANVYTASFDVYPAHAQGGDRPKRTIVTSASSLCGSIALRARDVFVSDAGTNTVYEYDKAAHGSPPPVATLSLPFTPCGVAAGP